MRIIGQLPPSYGLHPITYTDLDRPRHGQPVALYAAGLGCAASDIDPVAEILDREENIRVIGVGHPNRIATNIQERARNLQRVAEHFQLGRHAVIGHSLGGADALVYAQEQEQSVTGYASVMGNHMPTDGFWSGSVAAMTPEQFVSDEGFAKFLEIVETGKDPGTVRYASELRTFDTARRAAYHGVAEDATEQIRDRSFLDAFLSLGCVRYFIHGSQEQAVYLDELRAPNSGVAVRTISGAGHFPGVTHPRAYAAHLAQFIRRTHSS